MDDAERGVAIAHFRNQHAHGANVVDLAEFQTFALHFAPDRIDVFGPAADVGLDAGGQQFVFQLRHDVGDEALAIKAALMQQLGDLLVLLRLQIAEGQVLQLPLDVADAQSMGQGGIDVEDFPGDAVALLVVGVLHRANGAGAFSQLDQRNAHVVDHGHEHLAQVFYLRLSAEHQRLARAEAGADGRHALHAVDQLGNRGAETLADVRQGNLAFTHRAVNHGGDERVLVELEVGQDFGDFQARLKTRRAFRPEVLGGVVLLLGLPGKFTGFFQRLSVHCEIDADHMIKPCVEIDTAVCVDRLVCSHLYHVAYLPYGAMKCAISRRPSSAHAPCGPCKGWHARASRIKRDSL